MNKDIRSDASNPDLEDIRSALRGEGEWRPQVPELAHPASEPTENLSVKEAWWAGYRAGKGLPASTPRREALAFDTLTVQQICDIWLEQTGTPEVDAPYPIIEFALAILEAAK